MSSLTDLSAIVINVLFVFATVSYVSSAATDALTGLFKRRETLLARTVAQMLDDKRFEGLALEVYNDPRVNPRVNGTARNKAELGFLPKWIDPAAFAAALLEVLHIVPSVPTVMGKIQPLPVDETLPEAIRIENAIINATRRIEVESEARGLIQLLTNLLRRCKGRYQLMEQSIALWFEAGMQTATDEFRMETKLWNFAIGFGIAALLDLQPIPVGGLLALTRSAAPASQSAQVAQMLPLLVNLFEWGIVASSTLFGAQLWFSMLKSAVSRDASKRTMAPMPEATPPAGTGTPPADAGPDRAPAPARRKSRSAATTVAPGPGP